MTIYFVFLYQYGLTPLHEAVFNNNVKVVRLLIMAGAKTNVPDKVMICFILNKLQMCIIMEISIVFVQLIESSGIYCESYLFHSMV